MKIYTTRTIWRAVACYLLFSIVTGNLYAQNGTYEKKNNNGSYCYVSFQKHGDQIKAEIFAWWNTANARTGSYDGEGLLKGNKVILKSNENDPDCKTTIELVSGKLKATFADCSTANLTEDFNGLYVKITDATAGDYVVTANKTYFHRKPIANTKLKSYVVKGNKVTLNMDRIIAGNWVSVYYTSATGKETEGYIALADLKKIP